MLLKVLDALGVSQTVIAKGQESPVDHSGVITTTGQSQLAMDANAFRSGFLFQNVGSSPLWVNDSGNPADITFGNYKVDAGQIISSENFPVTTSAWNVRGTATDGYTLREW